MPSTTLSRPVHREPRLALALFLALPLLLALGIRQRHAVPNAAPAAAVSHGR